MDNNRLCPHVFAVAAAAILVFLAVMPFFAGGVGWQDGQDEYSLKLLAVSDEGGGTTASLHLKVVDGSGNVFIEASPVTKIDTRISLKLAKEIACQSLTAVTEKCGAHDFFFRLEANASLIGGPSAGAAAAALAIAAVDNAPINQSIAVTGTINSGGMIGNVGGLKDKIDAAAASGLSQVLIPHGERYSKVSSNITIDLVEYGQSLGVKVSEVKNVDDALLLLTGKNYSTRETSVEIDRQYSEVMGGLSGELCSRSLELSSIVSKTAVSNAEKSLIEYDNDNASATGQGEVAGLLEEARNQTDEGMKEKEKGSHYSAASLCFSANVKYSYIILLGQNISPSDAMLQLNKTSSDASRLGQEIPEAETLAEMQVRGTVKERIGEAIELAELGSSDFENGNYADGIYRLAFASERLGSARAWGKFLKQKGGSSAIPVAPANYAGVLRDGCVMRLQEAEERIQYLDVYLPGALKTEAELGPAFSYLRETDYSSCIYRASLATAKVNAMLSALGGSENLTELVDDKLKAAKKSIARQTDRGEFPIIGYSYYEYANTLKQSNPPSALLFSEYALELSNLDIYLKPGQVVADSQDYRRTLHVLTGAAMGFGLAVLIALIAALAAKRLPRRKKRIMVRAKKKH